MSPALSTDTFGVILGDVTLTAEEAAQLAASLGRLSMEAAGNARRAARRVLAAATWATALRDQPGVIHGEVDVGSTPVPALLYLERGNWRALAAGSSAPQCVHAYEIVSLPPMLVRDSGARTRHWWVGSSYALCGRRTSARPDAGEKHPVCPRCARELAKRGEQ